MAILCALFYAAVAIVILLVLADAIWSVSRKPAWQRSGEFAAWRLRDHCADEQADSTPLHCVEALDTA
jgi:hypothetical protein